MDNNSGCADSQAVENKIKALPLESIFCKNKEFLSVLICGSPGHGKSRLMTRIICDASLESSNATFIDPLNLNQEKREEGKLFYQLLSTEKLKLRLAEIPGDHQYPYNMVAGLLTADVVVLTIDIDKGMECSIKRQVLIMSLLGVKNIVIAINGIDRVGFSEKKFNTLKQQFDYFAKSLAFDSISYIPLSACSGDNIAKQSSLIAWYHGCTLCNYLESLNPYQKFDKKPFRMLVQGAHQKKLNGYEFSGVILSGEIAKGDLVARLNSHKKSIVKDITTSLEKISLVIATQNIESYHRDNLVSITLEEDIAIRHGDILPSASEKLPIIANQFSANVFWISEQPLYAGRPYFIRINSRAVSANITTIKHKINIENFSHISARSAYRDDIVVCNIATVEPIVFDSYHENREMGAFTIIEGLTNTIVGVGVIKYPLFRANNLSFETLEINKQAHSEIKQQKPVVIWFTGLSGSGKSTIANLVEKKLYGLGRHSYILDGDNVRHGLNRDLGFTASDRVENVRRIGEVAKLMVDAGLITLVSSISPFQSERQQARSIMERGEFIEVFVDTPIEVCQMRDNKGLYKKAIAGKIKNFTGISSPYEAPENPDIRLDTLNNTPDELADKIITYLKRKAFF